METSQAAFVEVKTKLAAKEAEMKSYSEITNEREKKHFQSVLLIEEQLTLAITENKKFERELTSLQSTVVENQQMKADIRLIQGEKDKLSGELNHLQQRADSLGRDLKKYMRDSAVSVAEFEKALIRKTEECDVSACVVCI